MIMMNCDMTPAQIYLYIDNYYSELWDRVLADSHFNDLVENFSATGIAETEMGQIILNSYQDSLPFFTFSSSAYNVNFNALWHIIENSDLLLCSPYVRNIVQTIHQNSFSAFMVNMAQATNKSFDDLYTDFGDVFTDYPEYRKNRKLDEFDIEFRRRIANDYKNKIQSLFADYEHFMEKHLLSLNGYSNKNNQPTIYNTKLLDLIQDRERFSLSYTADLIEKSENESLFSSLLAQLSGADISNYSAIFENWIAANKETLTKYEHLDFPFRIEQTAKSISMPAPAEMNHAAYTIDHKKVYAQPKEEKLSVIISDLSAKYSYGLIKAYNNLIRNYNLSFEDYNYACLIALAIFLYLGLPSKQVSSFMALFGLGFGVGPKYICPNSQYQEVYLKYLIDNGVSYQVLLSIL